MGKDVKKTELDAAFLIDRTSGRNRSLTPYKPPDRELEEPELSEEKSITQVPEQPGTDFPEEISETNVPLHNRQEVKESTKRKRGQPSYQEVFVQRNEIKHRQCVYISHEAHLLISRLVRVLAEGGGEVTVGGYIDKIIHEHLQSYKDDINELYRNSRPDLLK